MHRRTVFGILSRAKVGMTLSCVLSGSSNSARRAWRIYEAFEPPFSSTIKLASTALSAAIVNWLTTCWAK